MSQQYLNYQRIEKAIVFIEQNFKTQPTLQQIADHVCLSESHLERLFSEWAGTTPQRFLRYLTKNFAIEKLHGTPTLFDATEAAGLSSTSRLHDLIVNYEAMTPAELKQQGRGLTIRYGTHQTPFGDALIAITERGIVELHFTDNQNITQLLTTIKQDWQNAEWIEDITETAKVIDQIFIENNAKKPLSVLIKGTNFQIKVWEALLKIPMSQLQSYDDIAQQIAQPTAQRAVGTAIGSNRVAFLIPCHRVLQKVGGIGGYRWGTARKRAMLAWEMGQFDKNDHQKVSL